MTDAAWHDLIDAIGTVALVGLALAYLAWDRWVDAIEGRQQTKGYRDDDWG